MNHRLKTALAHVKPRRQRTQYSCVAASMTMCLHANHLDTTEDVVNRVLGASPMRGATWEQAIACAQHFGMRATLICPATLNQVREATDRGVPVMIGWNPEGRPWSHASVIFDVTDTEVFVADPNIPNPSETVRVLSHDDFYRKWWEQMPECLVRRPAMFIEREVSVDGRQKVASTQALESSIMKLEGMVKESSSLESHGVLAFKSELIRITSGLNESQWGEIHRTAQETGSISAWTALEFKGSSVGSRSASSPSSLTSLEVLRCVRASIDAWMPLLGDSSGEKWFRVLRAYRNRALNLPDGSVLEFDVQ